MNIKKTAEILAAIRNALKVIESATELKMQTSRLRGLLPPNTLDDLMLNSAKALNELHTQLKVEVTVLP